MKKIVNLLLYCFLGVVVSAGVIGMRHFMVQDQERTQLEAEARRQAALAQEQAEQEARQREEERKREESQRVVMVQSLPLYPEKKIQKVKAGRDTVCVYGETVLLLEEDGLYAKVQTGAGETGYVWSDCIAPVPDESVTADEQPKVVMLDVEQNGEEADRISFSVAGNVEKRLEALGYQAIMACRDAQETPSDAKRAELARQLEADIVVRICTGSEEIQKEAGMPESDDGTSDDGIQADPDAQAADPAHADNAGQGTNATPDAGQGIDTTQDAGQGPDTTQDAGQGPDTTQDAGQGTDATHADNAGQGTDADQADDAVDALQAKDVAVICSSEDNPHPAAEYYADSRKLGKYVLKYYQQSTGFDGGEMVESSEQEAVNRSKRPIVVLYMGSLQNEQQASRMAKPKFQAKMAKGITDGIDTYFRKKS